MFPSIGRVLLMGAVATATMDIVSTIARSAHIVTPLPPTLMGRWVAGIFQGQLWHANIEQATPVGRELGIALLTHYGVGCAFAVVYLYAASRLGVLPRDAVPAVIFGLVTSVFPWLLMFPAMGFGLFGARSHWNAAVPEQPDEPHRLRDRYLPRRTRGRLGRSHWIGLGDRFALNMLSPFHNTI